MACRPFKATAPDGSVITAIVCSRGQRRGRCRFCSRTSSALCDFPTPGQTTTCDAPMCRDCATQVGPDKDICPTHLADYRAQEKRAP